MDASLVTALFGLLGTIVGGLITFGTQWLLENRKFEIERGSLALSLASEVEAVLDRSERSEIDELLTTQRALAERGQDPTDTLKEIWRLDAYSSEPFPVFTANISKIGMLGFASGEVVWFYDWARSVDSFRKDVLDGKYDRFTPHDMGLMLQAHQNAFAYGRKRGRHLVEWLRSGDKRLWIYRRDATST